MKALLNYGHNLMALDIPDKNYMRTLGPKDNEKLKNTIGCKKIE